MHQFFWQRGGVYIHSIGGGQIRCYHSFIWRQTCTNGAKNVFTSIRNDNKNTCVDDVIGSFKDYAEVNLLFQ